MLAGPLLERPSAHQDDVGRQFEWALSGTKAHPVEDADIHVVTQHGVEDEPGVQHRIAGANDVFDW